MSSSHRIEALVRLGFSAFFQHQYSALLTQQSSLAPCLPARVLSEARGQFLLSNGQSSSTGVLAGRLRHEGTRVCVGDFVLATEADPHSLARIEHVFERSSTFQRKAPGGTSEAQLIAANVDLGIVVCALAPEEAGPHVLRHGLNPRRIERYLRLIRDAPAQALVAINKADLNAHAADHALQLKHELRSVPVALVSAEGDLGLAELAGALLPGMTAVLLGSSGVGKSSLANRLLGVEKQAVGEVASGTRGRHTTTGRELFELPSGGLLIDTPGMRELALFADDETDSEGTGFEEIDELAPECRFRDCRHLNEPGCAVLAAVEAGQVARDRLAQALLLEREAAYQRDRHDPLKMREKQAMWRARSRASRAAKKARDSHS